jgi:hypothetical protein
VCSQRQIRVFRTFQNSLSVYLEYDYLPFSSLTRSETSPKWLPVFAFCSFSINPCFSLVSFSLARLSNSMREKMQHEIIFVSAIYLSTGTDHPKPRETGVLLNKSQHPFCLAPLEPQRSGVVGYPHFVGWNPSAIYGLSRHLDPLSRWRVAPRLGRNSRIRISVSLIRIIDR